METHKGRKPHLIIVVMQRQAPTPSHHWFSVGYNLQEAPTSVSYNWHLSSYKLIGKLQLPCSFKRKHLLVYLGYHLCSVPSSLLSISSHICPVSSLHLLRFSISSSFFSSQLLLLLCLIVLFLHFLLFYQLLLLLCLTASFMHSLTTLPSSLPHCFIYSFSNNSSFFSASLLHFCVL